MRYGDGVNVVLVGLTDTDACMWMQGNSCDKVFSQWAWIGSCQGSISKGAQSKTGAWNLMSSQMSDGTSLWRKRTILSPKEVSPSKFDTLGIMHWSSGAARKGRRVPLCLSCQPKSSQ